MHVGRHDPHDFLLDLDLGSRRVVDSMTIFHRMEPRDLSAAVRFYLEREHWQSAASRYRRVLDEFPDCTIRIFSRDELKQSEMQKRYDKGELAPKIK